MLVPLNGRLASLNSLEADEESEICASLEDLEDDTL